MKNQVLDKGFIEVVDSLGNDLTVVNSARVSFGKRKKYWDKSDERLVRYLAKYKHYSPFRHLQVQFHIKAPEFVMRQWYKHVVGIETTSVARKDLAGPAGNTATGAGSSFHGAYLGDGFLSFNTEFSNSSGYYISTFTNSLVAGPIQLGSTLTLDGNLVIV